VGNDRSAFALISLWGKFGGLNACAATFSYIVPLPNIFLTRLFSKLRLKRKDFQEILRLLWAHRTRLQPLLLLILLTANVSNKSGNLLFAQSYPQWHENVGFLHSPCTAHMLAPPTFEAGCTCTEAHLSSDALATRHSFFARKRFSKFPV
jgi:hypothetical protein